MEFPIRPKLGGFGCYDNETFNLEQMIKDLQLFKFEHGGKRNYITGKELGDVIFMVNRFNE